MYQVPFTPAATVSFCTSYGDLENVFAMPACFQGLQCCRRVPAEFLFGDTMRIFGTTEKVLPPGKSCPRDFWGGGGPSHAQTTVCKPRNTIRLPPRQVCQEQPPPGSFPLGIPKRGRGRRALPCLPVQEDTFLPRLPPLLIPSSIYPVTPLPLQAVSCR